MTGNETSGFRINPDDLLSVAQKVQALLDDVSGGSGGTTGNHPDFQANAAPEHVRGALNSLFPHAPPSSAYVEAYTWEFKGLNEKYTAIVNHLTELQQRCRSTAEQYGASDALTESQANNLSAGI